MLDFSIYLLYRVGTAIAGALPVRLLFVVGKFLSLGAWLVLPQYRRLARRNLEIAFGHEKSRSELGRIARRNFQWLGANLLSGVKMASMPPQELAPYLAVENMDAIHRELHAGRPVILLLSHIGNWELFAQLIPHYVDYAKVGTIYQKLGNRYIDRDVSRKRARAGALLFDRSDGFHKPIELLRGGGLIGILGDQHAGDHGLWTPFFGRLASTSPLAGLLAKRTGAAVIAAAVHTESSGRWRLVFSQPLNSPADSVERITWKGNATIEDQVRRLPEDWFWVHNRWKTPQPNFLLAHYKRGVYLPPEIPATRLKPFRILIRAANWLGDSIITIPAVRAIKAGRPDAHLTVAAPKNIASIWKLVPGIDEVLPLEPRSLFAAVGVIRRQEPFDVAILFPNSLRSALEVWLGGIPRRLGFAGHNRRWLLNQVATPQPPRGPIQHQVYKYLRMVRELGGPSAAPDVTQSAPHIAMNGAAAKLGLCPGAEYGPAKRWLPERFAEVARIVAEHRPVQWILFGTAADAERGAVIELSLGPHCVNRIGQTTLEQLATELAECALLLTNDTGTMHLATLLGVPVVAVFGSTEPRLTGPLGTGHEVIRHQVECSPCFLRECPIDFRCMKSVTVEEVVAAVLSQLGEPQTSRKHIVSAASEN